MQLKTRLLALKSVSLVLALSLGFFPQTLLAGPAALSAPVTPSQLSAAPGTGVQPGFYRNIEVKEAAGEVTVKRAQSDRFETLPSGTVLHTGDFVKTGEGSCRLLIDRKDELTLAPRTLMRVNEASVNPRNRTTVTELNIESGRLKVSLEALKKGSEFRVVTPTAATAVRGTIFYLNAGSFMGQNATQIYVDKSHGGVVFKNTATGQSFIVPSFGSSISFMDGKLEEPHTLTPEQRDDFIKKWENPSSNALQQFGVEEIPNPNSGGSGETEDLTNEDSNAETNDASQDKQSEQNVAGSNGLALPDEATDEPSLDDQEKAMIRQEIARIRGDQDFDHADANLAQVSDAQTGKVFTDVFGNRVRTDQYIFLESGNSTSTVKFLSLTARTGAYQNGVSSVLFGTEFNRVIGGGTDLKSLPWDDYLHVVSREDVAANLGILQTDPAYSDLAGEYIIHEHAPALTQGPSALYPTHFFAQFTNPTGGRADSDLVRFDDSFSDPFSMDLETGEGLDSFVAQSKDSELMLVLPLQGEGVALFRDNVTGDSTITVGLGSPQPFLDDQDNGDGGSQTASFAANFVPGKLLDINYYRTLAVNNDGDPANDEHPVYFDNHLNDRLDGGLNVIGRNRLIGGFIPINDQGVIIDQPGFNIRSLRDLVSPNPLVNGGNYNLEVLLLYGYTDDPGGPNEGIFHEDFRIDTIITPGIFQGVGNESAAGDRNFASTVNDSALFPAALHPDDDDLPPSP